MRRALVVLALLAAVAAGARADPLDTPIARAGGEAALKQARVLAWRGIATVHAGGRSVRIGVDTVVEPFGYARSESWRIERSSDRRTLLIEGNRGWVIAGGKRTPMTPTMLVHERQQYALYGLMRLVSLREPGASVIPAPVSVDGSIHNLVRHPSAPVTTLSFRDGRLIGAHNFVKDSEGGMPIEQHFVFEGVITAAGVRWPRAIRIQHGAAPYFELTLTHFAAAPNRAAIEPLRAAWR